MNKNLNRFLDATCVALPTFIPTVITIYTCDSIIRQYRIQRDFDRQTEIMLAAVDRMGEEMRARLQERIAEYKLFDEETEQALNLITQED